MGQADKRRGKGPRILGDERKNVKILWRAQNEWMDGLGGEMERKKKK
jgi:hypothetical protein